MTVLGDLLQFGLFWCDPLVISLLTFFPVAVLAAWKARQGINCLAKLALCAGPLLAFQLGFLAVALWRATLRQPGEIVIDVSPFDDMLAFTINWSVPASLIGLLLIVLTTRLRPGTASVVPGVVVFALAAIATVMYGKWWFGSEWSEYIWWP